MLAELQALIQTAFAYAKEEPRPNLDYFSKVQILHILANDRMQEAPFWFLPVLSCIHYLLSFVM